MVNEVAQELGEHEQGGVSYFPFQGSAAVFGCRTGQSRASEGTSREGFSGIVKMAAPSDLSSSSL